MGTRLTVHRLDAVPYARAYAMQQRAADEVRAGGAPTLFLLQHPPTYTLGARARASNILAAAADLERAGATIVHTDRGGDVTFHGPGQLVGYPIVHLPDLGLGVRDYVCRLESVLIDTLAGFGIAAARSERNRGVWVGGAKIAAIGVRVSRGITTHGFALNVSTDLSWFDNIIPCGLPGVAVTSMQRELGYAPRIDDVADAFVSSFARHFTLAPSALAGVIA